MRYVSALLIALGCLSASAQPFAIGTTAITYFDAQRSRDVDCEIHYPATADGTDTPIATGPFPVLVIGHGFVMTVDAYTYLWQHFTPLGYIVVLPTTEGGFAPDHAEFGADLAFLAATIQAAALDALSPFYGQVAPATALMGHSMGGGAAFLGSVNSAIQTLVTLAPAETNPSAIAAAANVQVPTLLFAASEDCVTPIADHAQPLYDALPGPCKAFVNITGGGHCYFGDNSFTCSFGELTCGPNLSIDREEQQDVVTDVTDLWLDHFLRGSVPAFAALLDTLGNSPRFVAQNTCLSTAVPPIAGRTITAWFDAASDAIHLEGIPTNAVIEVYLPDGRSLQRINAMYGSEQFNMAAAADGLVHVVVNSDRFRETFSLMLVR